MTLAGAIVAVSVAIVLLRHGSQPEQGFDWGNFAGGTITSDGIVVSSQNWSPAHVTILRDQGPHGGNAALLVADDSLQLPALDAGGRPHVRIHGFRDMRTDPGLRWFGRPEPHEVAAAISVKVPQGYDLNDADVTTFELHGDNGTGPAPFNLDFRVGSTFELIVRGSSSPRATPYPFEQTTIGSPDGRSSSSGGKDFRRELPFLGGNVDVVLGRWVNFRLWWHDLSSDPEHGAFTAWVNLGPGTGWRKVADLEGLRTSYPDVNGDGQAVYPLLSLYYEAGRGGRQAVEYAAGRIEPSLSRLVRWQDARLGLP